MWEPKLVREKNGVVTVRRGPKPRTMSALMLTHTAELLIGTAVLTTIYFGMRDLGSPLQVTVPIAGIGLAAAAAAYWLRWASPSIVIDKNNNYILIAGKSPPLLSEFTDVGLSTDLVSLARGRYGEVRLLVQRYEMSLLSGQKGDELIDRLELSGAEDELLLFGAALRLAHSLGLPIVDRCDRTSTEPHRYRASDLAVPLMRRLATGDASRGRISDRPTEVTEEERDGRLILRCAGLEIGIDRQSLTWGAGGRMPLEELRLLRATTKFVEKMIDESQDIGPVVVGDFLWLVGDQRTERLTVGAGCAGWLRARIEAHLLALGSAGPYR